MADMDLRLIPEFDGGPSAPVSEWLEKLELVCRLRGITKLQEVIPLRLTGGAFAVYQQLSEIDKADVAKIKRALLSAFAQDSFVAYEQFVSRRLKPDEAADVYLADLRRLAALFGGVSDTALACAFVAGLPESVRQILRAGSRMEALSLEQLLTRARSIMADEACSVAAVAMRAGSQVQTPAAAIVGRRLAASADSRPPPPPGRGQRGAGGPAGGGTQRSAAGTEQAALRCFVCGGPNHLARDCLQRRRGGGQRVSGRCYRCGDTGHHAATCSENAAGEESAPASSPDFQ